MTPINNLKQWFRNGLKPTQEQFWAWMDSFWHKNEKIPQTSIDGLDKSLEAKAESTAVDAKANKDATDLGDENVLKWKEALGVGELPSNIATVDEGEKVGNTYSKDEIDSKLPKIVDATGDVSFTKIMVARPDGRTIGTLDRDNKARVKILAEDYTPSNNFEYIDVFTFDLKANRTYRMELGILGDERILSSVIVHNDVGNLSVESGYLIDSSGNWPFHLIKESNLDFNAYYFSTGLSYRNYSTSASYVIRPRMDTLIRIPVKSFSSVPPGAKLLAGTYMRIEEI